MKLNRTGSNWNRLERNKINENWDIIEGSYNDVVGQITDEVVGHLIDSAKLIWKEPVDTVEDLPANAEVGETRMVREADPDGISYVYRYDGDKWEKIQAIDVTLVNEVDRRLTSQMVKTVKDMETRGVNVINFGIRTDSNDNTQAFNNMVQSIPEGSKVLFPKGTYKGNFISYKSLDIDFQGSTIIPTDDSKPVLRFEGTEEAPKNVIGNPVYGDTSFTVENATGIQTDDIGYLVDDALRPTDNRPNQNTEVVKVKNVSGNTITVYDKIRSNQNTGNVRFVKINPLKNPSYKNVYFEIPDSHDSTISGFLRCERTYVDNVEVRNSSGLAVEHTLCFGFTIDNMNIIKPYQSTSGKGYGVGVYKSRLGSIRNVYGIYTRHLVDLDSSYHVTVEGTEDEYALSSSVVLSHNGYAGKITARKINIVLDNLANYGVQMSDQGLADVDKQCFRDIIIEDVEVTVPNHISGTLLNAVRILNHYADISIDNIKIDIQSDTENIPVNTTGVYLRGNQQGNLVIANIKAEKIETDVTVERKNSNHQDVYNSIINNIESKLVRNGVWLRGIRKSSLDNINVGRVGGTGRGILRTDTIAEVECEIIDVGNSIYVADKNVSDSDTVLISASSQIPASGFKGSFPKLTALSSSSLSLSNNYTIPATVFMKSQGYLQLLVPTSTESVTLNHEIPIEAPMWEGQELNIVINTPYYQGTRGDVIIPAGSETVYDDGNAITLQRGKMYKLLGRNRKWIVNQ